MAKSSYMQIVYQKCQVILDCGQQIVDKHPFLFVHLQIGFTVFLFIRTSKILKIGCKIRLKSELTRICVLVFVLRNSQQNIVATLQHTGCSQKNARIENSQNSDIIFSCIQLQNVLSYTPRTTLEGGPLEVIERNHIMV